MKFINNLQFYEDCKNALVECFGEEDLAAEFLKNTKYKEESKLSLLESVSSVNEKFADKLRNILSKTFGGSISKIDVIISKMRDAENDFIERENQIEKEYVQLFREFIKTKFTKDYDKARLGPMNARLSELEGQIRNLVKGYSGTMDELEKQVDIITKRNSRRADYYNLKRAKDAAEAKKKRANYKYELSKYKDDPEMQQRIDSIFGSAKKAEEESQQAEEELKQASARVSKYDPGDEWKSSVFKATEEKMQHYYGIASNFRDNMFRMVTDEDNEPTLDAKEYINKKTAFSMRAVTAKKEIERRVEKISNLVIDNTSQLIKDAANHYIESMNGMIKEIEAYEFPSFRGKRKKPK